MKKIKCVDLELLVHVRWSVINFVDHARKGTCRSFGLESSLLQRVYYMYINYPGIFYVHLLNIQDLQALHVHARLIRRTGPLLM